MGDGKRERDGRDGAGAENAEIDRLDELREGHGEEAHDHESRQSHDVARACRRP